MEKETHLLEINLISAQGLKPPSSNLRRRLQTYAMAWVDPAFKLRTRPDPIDAENPTWNEKFLFRVSSDFLHGDTSAVSVEIYAVGYINDPLVGTVRFLLSSCITASAAAGVTPAFTAVQVRRPSGRFHGVLNIAATVVNGLDFGAIAASTSSAICLRDLVEEKSRRRRRKKGSSEKSEKSSGGESCDFSDGADSTTSSSSSTAASTALKEWNCERVGGKRDVKSDGRGLLCGLMKVHFRPHDHNFRFLTAASLQENKEN